MVFEGVVRNGAVVLPPEAKLPEGTVVRIEADSLMQFRDLAQLAGTWACEDADRIVDEIYSMRSSAPPRPSLEP